MIITINELKRYHNESIYFQNLRREEVIHLEKQIFSTACNVADSVSEIDLSNIIVDAQTLEEPINRQKSDPNSEYEKKQREHKINFRKEILERGLQLKKDLEKKPSHVQLNY